MRLTLARLLCSALALSAASVALAAPSYTFRHTVKGIRVTGGSTPPSSPAPVLLLSTSSLSFGNQAVGTRSGVQQVLVTNTGSADMALQPPGYGGPYSVDTNCPSELAPQQSCLLSVSFQPTEAGERNDDLWLMTNAGDARVALNGTGAVAVLGLVNPQGAPASGQFGAVAPGSSRTETIVLRNTGAVAATDVFVQVFEPMSSLFTIGLNSCGTQAQPRTLPAGESCTVEVQYSPVAEVASSASLYVYRGASMSPQLSLTMGGYGLYAPTMSLSMNEALVDDQGHALSVSGALLDASGGREGGSLRFPDSASYVSLAPSNDWALAGDFTVEAWMQIPDAGIRRFMGQSGWQLHQNGTTLYFFDGQSWLTMGSAVPGTWTHVAVSRQGSVIRTFVNGSAGQSSTRSTQIGSASEALQVGRVAGSVEGSSGVSMDNIKLYNGRAKYTGSFVPQ